MKKFLAFILCFMYVVASSGATINFHYCMGKFIGWDVNTTVPTTCTNCGMHKETKKACCNDKHMTLQLKKDQLTSTINDVPNNFFVYTVCKHSSLINSFLPVNTDVVESIHSPPLIQNVPDFVFHCVFQI